MARGRHKRKRAKAEADAQRPAPASVPGVTPEQVSRVMLAGLLKKARDGDLKAIARLGDLGYGHTPATATTPKRVGSAPSNDTARAPAAPPPLPKPEGFSARDWLFVCAWLDTRGGQKTLTQAGRHVDPNSDWPRGIAWRTLQKPHVKAFIDAVREIEVAELGITRRTIAEGYTGILEHTKPEDCKKVVVVDGSPVEGGIDATALEVRRKTYKDLSQHLGLEPPKKVEVTMKSSDEAHRELAGQLIALVGRAADDGDE